MTVATRRLSAVLSFICVVLVSPASAQTIETRTVVDDLGYEVTIPVHPQRIAATNSEHIAPGLLELGANLIAMTARVNPLVNDGLPYAPAVHDNFDFRLQNSDIAFIGLQGNFDIEALAAAQPDLIIARTREEPQREQLMAIAPTVFLTDFVNDGAGLDRYRQLADLGDQVDRFEELNALWQDRLARSREVLEAMVGNPSEIIVAHITANAEGVIRIVNNNGMLAELFYDLGFSFPPIAAGGMEIPPEGRPGTIVLSPELLPELQTDFLFTRHYFYLGISMRDMQSNFDTAIPGWQDFVHAARNGQHVYIDLGRMESNTFASRIYTLDFLMTNIAMRPFVRVPEGTPRVPVRGE